MRLIGITTLGAALVAAGLVAPVSGEATAIGRGKVSFNPGVVHPGQDVELTVPGCADGGSSSAAFTAKVAFDGEGHGTAVVKRDAGPGTYPVVAQCGHRKVTGRLKISRARAWPAVLPNVLNGQ